MERLSETSRETAGGTLHRDEPFDFEMLLRLYHEPLFNGDPFSFADHIGDSRNGRIQPTYESTDIDRETSRENDDAIVKSALRLMVELPDELINGESSRLNGESLNDGENDDCDGENDDCDGDDDERRKRDIETGRVESSIFLRYNVLRELCVLTNERLDDLYENVVDSNATPVSGDSTVGGARLRADDTSLPRPSLRRINDVSARRGSRDRYSDVVDAILLRCESRASDNSAGERSVSRPRRPSVGSWIRRVIDAFRATLVTNEEMRLLVAALELNVGDFVRAYGDELVNVERVGVEIFERLTKLCAVAKASVRAIGDDAHALSDVARAIRVETTATDNDYGVPPYRPLRLRVDMGNVCLGFASNASTAASREKSRDGMTPLSPEIMRLRAIKRRRRADTSDDESVIVVDETTVRGGERVATMTDSSMGNRDESWSDGILLAYGRLCLVEPKLFVARVERTNRG